MTTLVAVRAALSFVRAALQTARVVGIIAIYLAAGALVLALGSAGIGIVVIVALEEAGRAEQGKG